MSFTKKELKRFTNIIAMIDKQDYSTAADFLAVLSDTQIVELDANELQLPPEILEELEDDEVHEGHGHGKGKGKHPKLNVEVEVEVGSKEASEVNVLLPQIKRADDALEEQENIVETDLVDAEDKETSPEEQYILDIGDLFKNGPIKNTYEDTVVVTLHSHTPKKAVLKYTWENKDHKGYAYKGKGTATITPKLLDVKWDMALVEKDPKNAWLPPKGRFVYNTTYKKLFDTYESMKKHGTDYNDGASFSDNFISEAITEYTSDASGFMKDFITKLEKLKDFPKYDNSFVRCEFIIPNK